MPGEKGISILEALVFEKLLKTMYFFISKGNWVIFSENESYYTEHFCNEQKKTYFTLKLGQINLTITSVKWILFAQL